jgi:hypothetical protein
MMMLIRACLYHRLRALLGEVKDTQRVLFD